MWAGLILIFWVFGIVAIIATITIITRKYQRKARQVGYASLGDYLRAVPRDDEEKREAVDLSLKGLVICLLGLAFPPFLLIGIIPFFFGTRKLTYALMGFGLTDDADHPSK